ncbi:MAG: SDR family NAD(P)-dependent oxidoreductase [Planctomycetes bacterium]|nr:SDR family NAD(P)-dependent oxidoreductase [Planctomycetota bacterium]
MADGPILITGAAGFIGSSLTDRLLAEGRSVVGVDNFCDFYDEAAKRRNVEAAMASPRFELIEADIRDRSAILETFARHRPGVVVHLAAMAGVRPSIERPEYYTAVNLDGTVNMLDAAVANGAERFVFASSSSVYGNNPKTPFGEEDNVDHPISPYAATKKAGELLCHTYWHLHRLPCFCLRFFTVFGPRQRPDLAINKFLRLVSAGKPIPMFGDGSSSRDYTFIDDIVTGVRAAMDKCDRYRVYNLGGNHPTSLKELIATVEGVTGKKAVIQPMPMQPGDVERTWADLTRSRAELGYEPRTSMRDGIAKQWEWMREQA